MILRLIQFNVSIPSSLKEEIKEQAKQSNLHLADFVRQILESYCQGSTVLNTPLNVQVKQPKEPPLKTTSNSIPTDANSQLDPDHVNQCLNDRLNRLEGVYVNLMIQIQEPQSLKNFYPLLSQLNEQPFSVGQTPSQQDLQRPLTEAQVPEDDQIKSPSNNRPKQTPTAVASKTLKSSSASKTVSMKKPPKQATSANPDSFDWLTTKEAYQIACQRGYEEKLFNFASISRRGTAIQQYAQLGFICDPTRKGRSGQANKWFRCLTDLEQEVLEHEADSISQL